MHRIFRVKAYEMEHGPHFNKDMLPQDMKDAMNKVDQ